MIWMCVTTRWLRDGTYTVRMTARPEREHGQLRWFWEGRIPRGYTTVITGGDAQARTALLWELVAHATTGRPWPDGAPCQAGRAVVVLIRPDTYVLTPQVVDDLCAAGADTSRVTVMSIYQQSDDARVALLAYRPVVSAVHAELRRTSALGLVIVDGISECLADTSSRRERQAVHDLVWWLDVLAERYRTACVVTDSADILARTSRSMPWVWTLRRVYPDGPHYVWEPVRLGWSSSAQGVWSIHAEPLTFIVPREPGPIQWQVAP